MKNALADRYARPLLDNLHQTVQGFAQASSAFRISDHTNAEIPQDVRDLVDWFIETRARHWVTSWYAPAVKPLIHKAVLYDNLCRLIAKWRYCASGEEMASAMLALMEPRVSTTGMYHLPPEGGCIIATNHPTGLPDGLALYDQVRQVRRDVALFVFADLLTINPNADDVLIPVEWQPGLRDRSAMRRTMAVAGRAFRDGRCVGIFPSGRLSYWDGRSLRERTWNSSFLRMATKYKIPIVPGHIRARNSLAFYAMSQISTEFRDIQSIREIQNKQGAQFHITFGPPIAPDSLVGDQEDIAARMQRYVEDELAQDHNKPFRT